MDDTGDNNQCLADSSHGVFLPFASTEADPAGQAGLYQGPKKNYLFRGIKQCKCRVNLRDFLQVVAQWLSRRVMAESCCIARP